MSQFISTSALLLLVLLSACKTDVSKPIQAESNTPTIDSITGQPIRLPNPWKSAACDLVTDQEFFAAFNIEEKRDFANKRTLPNDGYCMRTWKKPDWREREAIQDKNPNIATNPESVMVIQVIDFGTQAVASAQFDMHKRDRINGYATDVPDLGEGALWSDSQSMILVKKGHLFVQIKLEYTDNASDNLTKAKELAAIALKKM